MRTTKSIRDRFKTCSLGMRWIKSLYILLWSSLLVIKSTIIAFKMQISINNTLFARSVMIISKQQSADGTCPGRQQKIESIRDRIRWAVWIVVITGNDCNRFEIDPIWTQSGFIINRTNLNRSQSIYMWTRSKFPR